MRWFKPHPFEHKKTNYSIYWIMGAFFQRERNPLSSTRFLGTFVCKDFEIWGEEKRVVAIKHPRSNRSQWWSLMCHMRGPSNFLSFRMGSKYEFPLLSQIPKSAVLRLEPVFQFSIPPAPPFFPGLLQTTHCTGHLIAILQSGSRSMSTTPRAQTRTGVRLICRVVLLTRIPQINADTKYVQYFLLKHSFATPDYFCLFRIMTDFLPKGKQQLPKKNHRPKVGTESKTLCLSSYDILQRKKHCMQNIRHIFINA